MVLYEIIDPHVAQITLNRPHRRNAVLTAGHEPGAGAQDRRAEDDDDVKVIVLAGSGEDFCAGEDIARVPVETFGQRAKGKRLAQSPRIHGIQELQAMSWALLKCDKTVIASVQGGALGLGLQSGALLRHDRGHRRRHLRPASDPDRLRRVRHAPAGGALEARNQPGLRGHPDRSDW